MRESLTCRPPVHFPQYTLPRFYTVTVRCIQNNLGKPDRLHSLQNREIIPHYYETQCQTFPHSGSFVWTIHHLDMFDKLRAKKAKQNYNGRLGFSWLDTHTQLNSAGVRKQGTGCADSQSEAKSCSLKWMLRWHFPAEMLFVRNFIMTGQSIHEKCVRTGLVLAQPERQTVGR